SSGTTSTASRAPRGTCASCVASFLGTNAAEQLHETVFEIEIDDVTHGRAQTFDVRRHAGFPSADDPALPRSVRRFATQQPKWWIRDFPRRATHEQPLGPVLEPLHRRRGDQSTVVHDGHPVAHPFELVHEVARDENRGGPFG